MSIMIQNVTKTFSPNTGIFNIDVNIHEGEVFGYLGPNGAGKTTTIRNLMGFMKPDSGRASIKGLDCWTQKADIKKVVGYLPGEISFIEGMTGLEMLRLIGDMRGLKDVKLRDRLIERFDINTKVKIKKMSKGMKQKIGIVAAFMHDPEILILDEPSSGLDPLMQNELISLILEEKRRGKTMLLSSHIFEEVSRTCDRISIIKEGRLVITDTTLNLEANQGKIYDVSVNSSADIERLLKAGLDIVSTSDFTVSIKVTQGYREFISALSHCEVTNIEVTKLGLEELFLNFYSKGEKGHE